MDDTNLIPQSIHKLGDSFAETFKSISQHILVAVLGVLPIIFIPSLSVPLSYTKSFIVLFGLIIVLVIYSFTILRSGTIRFSLFIPSLVLWLIAATALISGLLSGDVTDSLVGTSLEQQTAVFLALLALVATVTAQILTDKKAVLKLYAVLAVSSIVLGIFHIARLIFGADFLAFGIFSGNTLSPIGSWNDLAIFFCLVILLALVALEQLTITSIGKWIVGGMVAVSLLMLTVINFSAIWVVLGMVSLVVLVYALAKDKFGDTVVQKHISTTSILVASAVFAVSVVFIIGGSVIGGAISQKTGISYLEVRPSFQATTALARATYSTDALFGIGPNRFADAWRLSKDPSLNSTVFWANDFYAGVGYIPTFFITLGAVGGILWIAFLALFIWMGTRMLLRVKQVDPTWYFIGTSSFVAGAFLWGMSVIYVPGAVLLILAALATGLLATSQAAFEPFRVRTLSLSGSKSSGFVLVTLVLVVIVGSVTVMYGMGREYLSAEAYAESSEAMARGSLDDAQRSIENSYKFVQTHWGARRIAEIQLVRLVNLLQNTTEPSADVQAQFQNLLVTAVNAGKTATQLDATDPNNWGILGTTLATVVPLKIDGAYVQAKDALMKAQLLDPKNPARYLALARLEVANGNADGARAMALEAIKLKNDYIDAIFFLSQVEIASGNIDSAISTTESTILLDPQNPVRRFQLGILKLAQNKFGEAASIFESAISLSPDYANARYYLALTYDKLGRSQEAREQLEAILKTNEGNELVLGLIKTIDAGGRLTEQDTNQGNLTPPVDENTNDENAAKDPNSPLLTPVNTVPDAPKTTNSTEE